ncbi:hypothetical protein [Aquibium sp. ELW1220]|uniref:hypothetical protein n=1 Tax=Aquibium sp. ELW1220 TaxID=2976766 RepID=UPI0025AF4C69|nr:hypothetical protein [Aquibium sp. ELW1220]MDN2584293.1 hypothetical protein [Aquibium sp. ELW1220]
MARRLFPFARLALIFLAGTLSANPCEFASRNADTMNSRIERAIKITNAAVRDSALELYFANPAGSDADRNGVPVHHIRPDPDRPVVAEVPAGCRSIVVSGVHFDRNFAALAEDNVLMQDKQIPMLVFLLLHELGHVANEHYGAFLPDTSDAVPSNVATDSKERERQADSFVATILKREFDRMGTGTPPIQDYDLYFGITDAIMFLSSLSFIVSSEATLDCFGCRSLGDPRIFWDHGQSHPNLEYRLLLINHAISETPESRALLESYEQGRDDLADRPPLILYQQ